MKRNTRFKRSAPPSRVAKDAALFALLIHREDLDGLDRGSLARSYGKSPADIDAAIAKEKLRRATAPV